MSTGFYLSNLYLCLALSIVEEESHSRRKQEKTWNPPEISLETGSRLRPQEVPVVRYEWDIGSDQHQLTFHTASPQPQGRQEAGWRQRLLCQYFPSLPSDLLKSHSSELPSSNGKSQHHFLQGPPSIRPPTSTELRETCH